MSVVCYLQSDLSRIRLLGDGVDDSWSAAPFDESGPIAAQVGARARDGAEWAAGHLGRSRRLGAVVISIEDAICTRVTAPSPTKEVLTAALGQREREWTSESGGTTVQALAPPRTRRTMGKAEAVLAQSSHLTVVELHDGPVRLWLDQLDRKGVSPASVITLWNGMAQAWPAERAAPHALTAVVLELDEHLVWSWSRQGELAAAGLVRRWTEPAPEPDAEDDQRERNDIPLVPPRLLLDWLAWSAQLGDAPAHVTVAAGDPAPIIEALDDRWPRSQFTRRSHSDPLGATLAALGDAAAESDDPRRCVVDLTHRPGRAHRWLAYWTIAAVLMLAVGIGAIGARQRAHASEAREIASAFRADVETHVRDVAPDLVGNPSPARALQSVLVQERESNKPIEAPQPPYPIFEELRLASEAIAGVIADKEDATVRSMKIDELQADILINVPDFATGEAIFDALRAQDGRLNWTSTFQGSGAPPTTQRLRATWGRGPS